MFLLPLAWVYSLILCVRAWLYKSGIVKTERLARPVISIGNVTVGGTGKTPVTAHIARQLIAKGVRVVVLSRGYGGTCEGQTIIVSDGNKILLSAAECGDEPYLLARTLPGLMVVIGADRYAAGLLAMERLNPDILLLDDGFQHLRLHRDLNILLLDYVRPFGNGWTLPAGLLREHAKAACRADWIIHTRCQGDILEIPFLTHIPQTSCRYRLGRLLPLNGGNPVEIEALSGCGIIASAGIAEPEQFFCSLEKLGLRLLCRLPLADHVEYDVAVISKLKDALLRNNASYCIVTEKDAVKLIDIANDFAGSILVAPLELEMEDSGLVLDILNLL